jgi:uncharacterized membrane protein YhfC
MNLAGPISQLMISLIIPIAFFLYFRKKQQFAWKPLWIGAAVFILFSQVLEKLLHIAMIDQSGTALKWTDHPAAFVLYGALAAGVFEELGRYVGFRFWLKGRHEYKDGLSFGLGHGGIEAILIGVIGAIYTLVLMQLIRSGTFDETLGAALSAEQASTLKEQIMNTPFAFYVLGGLERGGALIFHITMSLLVLLGVRTNRFRYVLYAIAIHALLDVAPAMYQAGILKNIWAVEGVLALFAVASLFVWNKLKRKLVE